MTGSTNTFFRNGTTKRHIGALAESEALCIYAGAGATIDQTGLSWSGLAELLLRESLPPGASLPENLDSLGVQRLASVASERLERTFGETTQERIAQLLRPVLYRDSSWVPGRLLENIVQLAQARASRDLPLSVLTTNYDDYLQRAFSGRTGQDDSLIQVVYLHGRIPSEGAATPIVFSEADYNSSSDGVTAALVANFAQQDVLIVGSSMTDPPLLRALLETKEEATRSGRKRLILMPQQGNGLAQTPAGQTLLRDAARHFGCEVAFPDFYSQVAQFIHEVRTCLQYPSEYSKEVSTIRYGARLNRWWTTWMAATEQDLDAQQSGDHQALRTLLQDIRSMIKAPEHEALKIELWIRWKPESRKLRLWCSSIGPWSDRNSMREGDIRADSPYVSVRAFCEGRPLLDSSDSEPDRWRSYLAIPVGVTIESGNDTSHDHVAGVITLASMSAVAESSVSLNNRAALRRAILELYRVASSILQRQPEDAELRPIEAGAGEPPLA